MKKSRNHKDEKTERLFYTMLRVRRSLTEKELAHINKIDDDERRVWELDRQSLLFEIAVLAKSADDAVSRLRGMLASPELIIERYRL